MHLSMPNNSTIIIQYSNIFFVRFLLFTISSPVLLYVLYIYIYINIYIYGVEGCLQLSGHVRKSYGEAEKWSQLEAKNGDV